MNIYSVLLLDEAVRGLKIFKENCLTRLYLSGQGQIPRVPLIANLCLTVHLPALSGIYYLKLALELHRSPIGVV